MQLGISFAFKTMGAWLVNLGKKEVKMKLRVLLWLPLIQFIYLSNANAGLISLSINGGVSIPASGGPGGQGYTLTTPEVGTSDNALFGKRSI